LKNTYNTALIVGAGDGLSAAIAHEFSGVGGMSIAPRAIRPSLLHSRTIWMLARCNATQRTPRK
jgi:NAD(P)-dependent dehydrogenase (short-subunit alcohol dehydrogenase family)